MTGDVSKPLRLDTSTLAILPQHRVEIGGKVYGGVSLWDVVSASDPVIPAGLRNANLSMYVIARAGDGYQVLFSFGEIDPALSGRQVLIALSADGQPLTAPMGPFRLVTPGDRKAARAVFGLIEIEVRAATR